MQRILVAPAVKDPPSDEPVAATTSTSTGPTATDAADTTGAGTGTTGGTGEATPTSTGTAAPVDPPPVEPDTKTKAKKRKKVKTKKLPTKKPPPSLPAKLSSADIKKAMRAVDGAVKKCGLKGALPGEHARVELTVSAAGAVTGASVTSPDLQVTACIKRVVQKVKLPKAKSGGTYSHRFKF